jgi:outer membrane protein TolC
MIGSRPASAIVLVLALLAARTAPAEDTPVLPDSLTVEQAVAMAIERNYDVQVAAANLLAAQGRVWQSYRGFLPSIDASASLSHQEGRTPGGVDETGRLRVGKYSTDNQQVGIGLSQMIFSWANIQSVKGARAGERAGRGLSGAQKLDVALAVRVQFYELLKAMRLAEVRDEAVSLAEDQLRRAETLFELGSVARNDVLQARVNLQQARLDQIAARNRVELERGRLNQLLSLPVNTPLRISRTIDTRPRAAIDSTAVVAEALDRRPDLAAARERVKAAEASLGAARASHYPELFGNLDYGKTYYPGQGAAYDPNTGELITTFDNDNYGWSARGGVRLNVFDGLLAEGQVKSARGNLNAERARLDQSELAATLEVKESILGVREATQSIAAATEGVSLAEENLKLAEERYNVGSGTILELDEAQVSLIEARSALVDAWAALFAAEAQLDRARGAGLPATSASQ